MRRVAGVRTSRPAWAAAAAGGLTAVLAAFAVLGGIDLMSTGGGRTTAPVGEAEHAAPPAYYLAPGDSLSQGVQPATPPLAPGDTLGESVETGRGYADDIAAHYAPALRGRLRLEKLGCPGETTTSMLTGDGSPCRYPQGSQVTAALAFLKAHPGEVGLITLDIGANDVDGCVTGGATSGVINQACTASGIAALRHDLPLILGALRRAAGPRTLIAAMNLYDPFLAGYLDGAAGQATAAASVPLDAQVNALLGAADQKFGVRTADVRNAFSTADFTDTATRPGGGTVPLNVDRICSWTWTCAPAPVGPNIHANTAGYQVIAAAFERVIGPRL